MTKVEALAKIKSILFGEEKQFTDGKLADGTIIRYDGEFAVGAAVMVIDTDGNELPITDGEHSLEDGTTFTTEGGLVITITPAEEMEVDDQTMEIDPEIMTMLEDLATRVKALEDMTAGMSTEGLAKETEVAALTEKLNSVFLLVEKIAAEPIDEPTHVPTSMFKKEKSDRFKNIHETIKQLKK